MSKTYVALVDHRKIGTKFIPPFVDKLGSTFKETSWVKNMIPELVWIALINYRYGYQQGADLSLSLAKATKYVTKSNEWYAPISSFSSLTKSQKDKICSVLSQGNKLDKISVSLSSLNHFYPQCPLEFLYKRKTKAKIKNEILLSELKNTLLGLYVRHSKESTFTQANAIYICFVLGKLKVYKGSALANFPEIEKYPNTEESKKVASSVRASLNGFIGLNISGNRTDWPEYFWKRSLEIDKCE